MTGQPVTPVRAPVLAAVDRAAFAVALGERLRRAGVPVSVTGLAAFTDALGELPATHVRELYWTARVTLVHRSQDLAAFDAVFAAVFDAAALARDASDGDEGVGDEVAAGEARAATKAAAAGGLPWHTPNRADVAVEDSADDDALLAAERLPSAVAALEQLPFEQLDASQLALVGAWLADAGARWPTRRSRRRRSHPGGRTVELRQTIAASRRTGWEPLELRHSKPVRRPRALTVVADVSASMKPYSTAYLHLMRALALSRHAEAFAFSTSLTRVTPALRHRSAEAAVREASDLVVDRHGGTHLAGSLGTLLRSRHGNRLRGGVLVVASDGWDSDDPDELARVLARVRRRVHRLVWLNPRAGAAGFQPLVGSMAAALPFCDDFLPAHTLRAMTAALDAILER